LAESDVQQLLQLRSLKLLLEEGNRILRCLLLGVLDDGVLVIASSQETCVRTQHS
jgi:hypothetical protein